MKIKMKVKSFFHTLLGHPVLSVKEVIPNDGKDIHYHWALQCTCGARCNDQNELPLVVFEFMARREDLAEANGSLIDSAGYRIKRRIKFSPPPERNLVDFVADGGMIWVALAAVLTAWVVQIVIRCLGWL